jgi:hypothetical protein
MSNKVRTETVLFAPQNPQEKLCTEQLPPCYLIPQRRSSGRNQFGMEARMSICFSKRYAIRPERQTAKDKRIPNMRGYEPSVFKPKTQLSYSKAGAS